ncbi:MAG: VapE domain-containing protein, partial [Dolichospermum sp.]
VKEGWGDKLRFNQLTKEIELAGNELNEDEVRLTMALDFDIDVSNADAHSIINRLAKADEYSPVVEYLDEISQKYNDIDPSILDGLSLKYFGSSEPMHAIYLKKFLVGAVARARNPGCKLDTVLMLVGAQGCGKSAFLENLFGRRFFSDQIGGELNDKDEKAKVSRYWCLEYAEFEAVYKKKDVSSLKRFITAKEDTFRAPYARKEARHPRPSLFAGTTNETEILLDPTGDRRFWVL